MSRPPAKRKLVFETPPADMTKNIETDVNFPRQWKIAGVDIDARVQKLREDMRAQGHNPAQNAVVDPNSKFRTEYRRILTAHSIITDAIRLCHKEISWFRNATEMMANDIEALRNRREHLDKKVEELKEQLSSLDASVGILKSQQLAVKSVLDLREDEYMGGDDDDDGESSLPDEYRKFGKISKLCEVALKSYDDVKKRTEQLQKTLVSERNRERRQREAILSDMEEKERTRVEELDDLFQDMSVEQLRELRDRMREARGAEEYSKDL